MLSNKFSAFTINRGQANACLTHSPTTVTVFV